MKIKIISGKHQRGRAPVTWEVEKIFDGEGEGTLLDKESGEKLPFFWETYKNRNRITSLLPCMLPGEEKVMEIKVEEKPLKAIELIEKENEVEVRIGGKIFTSFRYSQEFVRPFLFPVYSPSGKLLVRKLLENKPGVEHPHHRGIWVAHGDVNGADNWSEMEGHGYQILKDINVKERNWWGRIEAFIDWTDKDKEKILGEKRIITFYSTSGVRFIDFDITFYAENDVKLGDTKEAGILSVRVNPSMNASDKGIMENSVGGINEDEIWGKKASWCDYSGPVEEEWWGISVFDNPENPFYPTNWHARNYGLMTANHYGLSYFYGKDKAERGDLVIKGGESLNYKFRVYIHPGNAKEGKVSEKYIDYVNPSEIRREK